MPSTDVDPLLDDSMMPLVLTTYPARPCVDDWNRIFDGFERIHRTRQRYYVVSDAMQVDRIPTAAERKLLADRSREIEADTVRWTLGSAIAIPNALVRGGLTAIAWMAPPKYKLTYHASLLEALDEALSTFEAQGVSVPETVHAYRRRLDSPHR
jgi:hypothetical protein